jgi:hypothetical protein
VDGVGNLGGVASKIEVSTDRLLRRRTAAEGVIIEGIVRFVELVAEAVVGILEVDSGFGG